MDAAQPLEILPNALPANRLPTEIYIKIFHLLPRPDLVRCLLVSRSIHLIILPLIYKVLDVDLIDSLNPLWDRRDENHKEKLRLSSMNKRRPGVRRSISNGIRGVIDGIKIKLHSHHNDEKNHQVVDVKTTPGVVSSSTTSNTAIQHEVELDHGHLPILINHYNHRPLLPDRFSFTTHLTITSHTVETCGKGYTLSMPNLQTLRIIPSWQENHLDICHQTRSESYEYDDDEDDDNTPESNVPCRLLKDLRPRKMIMGSVNTGLTGQGLGLGIFKNDSPPYQAEVESRNDDKITTQYVFPCEWVKELVIYVGGCSGIEIGQGGKTYFLDKIPITLDRLTLIMQPQGFGRWTFRRVAGFEGFLNPKYLWEGLGKACIGDAKQVEIVGLEFVDRDLTEMSLDKEIELVRREILQAALRKGCLEERSEKISREVMFISRGEYDKREGLKGDHV